MSSTRGLSTSSRRCIELGCPGWTAMAFMAGPPPSLGSALRRVGSARRYTRNEIDTLGVDGHVTAADDRSRSREARRARDEATKPGRTLAEAFDDCTRFY